jgi:beta-glucosidase
LTFPQSLEQLPAFDDYSMVGRTYRYMTAEPLFPFGFGLSYSSFEYSDLKLDQDTVAKGDALSFQFTLTNTGTQTAAEVAQIYLSDLQASTIVPLQHLVGFERVELQPGANRIINFEITPEMMSFFNDEGKLTLESGEIRLEVGGCSPSARGQALGAPKPLVKTFTVK